MSRSLFVLLALTFTTAVSAEPMDIPYDVEFNTCNAVVQPVQIVASEYEVKVNDGAKDISEGLCTEQINNQYKAKPDARIIRFLKLNTKDRGIDAINKKRVYCTFGMEAPLRALQAAPECGVLRAVRVAPELSPAVVEACLQAQPRNQAEVFQRTQCLLDGYKDAIYLNLNEELSAAIDSALIRTHANLLRSGNKNLLRLAEQISAETNLR